MTSLRFPSLGVRLLFVALAGAGALAACKPCPETKTPTTKGHSSTAICPPCAGASAAAEPASCTKVESGLSEAEQREFFHLSEGSEILPLFLLQELGMFKNPERFGLLPDEADPKRLPIGVSRNRPKDVKPFGVDFVGFNCAACHVAKVSVGSCSQLVMGAPSRFDIRGFFGGFSEAFEPHNNLRGYLRIFKWYVKAVINENKDESDSRRTDLRVKLNLVEAAQPDSPLEQRFQKAFEAKQLLGIQPGAEKDDLFGKRLPLPAGINLPFAAQDEARLGDSLRELDPAARKKSVGDALEDFYNLVQLLRARLAFVGKVTKSSAGQTVPGPGRVDAFVTALNLIYDAKLPITSPVSYPHLWGLGQLHRFHWDDNTTSILDRNIGQALGLGAVFTKKTSTVEIKNIDKLEELAEKMQPPKWPFGGVPNDVSAGQKVFDEVCKSCHTPDASGNMPKQPPLAELGTDDRRIANMKAKIDGNDAIVTLGKTLGEVKTRAYDELGLTKAERDKMERGRPIEFKQGETYSARPLTGVWATAPYLHNNSVPTLAHLIGLKPRPQRFSWVRGGDYDTVDVGLRFVEEPHGELDTSQKNDGNSSAGHVYGTHLDEASKRALLEYLKTL